MAFTRKFDFSASIKSNPIRSTSLFLLIGSLILAAAQLYKGYVINTGYDRPAPLMIYPIIFQYVGFSVVPLLFSSVWRLSWKSNLQRTLLGLTTLVAFILLYLLVFNTLEWYAIKPKYDLWPSYPFVLLHSGPWVAVIYLAIAGFMLLLGMDKKNSPESKPYMQRIPVKNRNETSYIPVQDVLFLEASDNYISILTSTGHPQLVRQTLASIEEELDPGVFQRVHRKYIVNLQQIQSWKADPNGGYLLNMPGDHQLKMSKSYKDKLGLLMAKA